MVLGELAVADAGHEEVYVSLDVYWEFLHLRNKLGSSGNIDGAVDLEVQEIWASECVVFVAKCLAVTGPT